MKLILVLLTCANEIEAKKISQILLEKKLIACAKRLAVTSEYWWKGDIENAKEVLLMMETLESKFAAIEQQVKKLHSYEQFVMLQIPVTKASAGTGEWVRGATDD